MILSTLYLEIGDYVDVSTDYRYQFLKRSRVLCNYIEREVLREIKFPCDGFNRLVVSLCDKPSKGVFINSCQVACVEVQFNKQEYDSKRGGELIEYYIAKLKKGLRKCSRSQSIPLDEMLEGVDRFITGGGKNEWLFKSRTFRDHSLKASLFGALSMEHFTLRLQVLRQKEIVLDEIVLETVPNEVVYAPKFKDLETDEGSLVITSRRGKPLWKKKISKIV